MSDQPMIIEDKNSGQARMWPIISAVLLSILLITEISPTHSQEMDTFPIWSKVELDFDGPDSLGMGEPNPFQVSMEIAFTGPGEQVYMIPGFYDGDGAGGLDGSVWRVRFSPDQAGIWTYLTSSEEESLNRLSGTFQVSNNEGCHNTLPNGLPDFYCVGRLEYTGEHYLKFANGEYWLKSGANEPEDFLVPGVNGGFSSKSAAIDYLANKSINSIYLMLDNIDGDRKNIWPWVGETQTEAKLNHERFDVAKLGVWEDIFELIQQRGLVLHLVFEDDSAWTGFNRDMYYREMVARFGHFNGLYWNLVEEYNEVYSANQIKEYAQILKDFDPYQHPLTVHQQGELSNWEPFLGDMRFDLTSFQTSSEPQNSAAANWFEKVENSGRIIPVAFDESTRLLNPGERDKFRQVAWSIYAGGGNYEVYTRLGSSGFQEYEQIFADLGRARKFLTDLDFWEMRPENQLLTSGDGYVLAAIGKTYLVYLPEGGRISIDLSQDGNKYESKWFNPRDGSSMEVGLVDGGKLVEFLAPDTEDWVLLLQADHSTPPRIFSIPDTEATVGQIYQYVVQASGDPSPIFSLINAPQGMSINPVTGHVEWQPATSGEFIVEIQAENKAGLDKQLFTLIVLPIPVQEVKIQYLPIINKSIREFPTLYFIEGDFYPRACRKNMSFADHWNYCISYADNER